MERTTAGTAAALLIGNEILSGKVREANLYELAGTLRRIGVSLERVSMVADRVGVICEEVRSLAGSHDVLFTSGGIGPTHDDVTIEAIARAFDAAVTTDPTMEELVRTAYGERCTDAHLRMALVPQGARLVVSKDVSWPTVVMRNVWILPGVPEIFRMRLAAVRDLIRGRREFVTRAVYTRLDEGALKPLLDDVVSAAESVEVGSYPKFFDPRYRTKVTFDADDEAKVDAAVERFLRLLPAGEPQDID